jgi:hypothetical protein
MEEAGISEKLRPVPQVLPNFEPGQCLRIWERPVDEVLAPGLLVLPLVPVSAVNPERLPDVLTAMARRLEDEATPERAKLLGPQPRS